MSVKGYVINNTGKPRHIFQRRVSPGDQIDLEYVYTILGSKAPNDLEFIPWLKTTYLPEGWDIVVENVLENPSGPNKVVVNGREMFKEIITAKLHIAKEGDEERGSTEYGDEEEADISALDNLSNAPATLIKKLTARQISNLKVKDNPRRALKEVDSFHKLKRALHYCRQDNRKEFLAKLIQARMKQLVSSSGAG